MSDTTPTLTSLLTKKRFGPFFLTQFLGAFNDNVFKNALIILIAFKFAVGDQAQSDTLVNLCAGLFILPFFLFSAIAGQVADRMDKALLMQRIKLIEILLMSAAAIAFLSESLMGLMLLLFAMGTQSAFFGPTKYSVLPQHLKPAELIGGNSLVAGATFLAILLGTVLGGVLVAKDHLPMLAVSTTLLLTAALGYLASRAIPLAPATPNQPPLRLNPFTEVWSVIQAIRPKRALFLSILGVSWFWFFGAIYITQLPNLTRMHLGGNEHVVVALMACFSLGIGAGSWLCHRLSGGRVEPALVPIGAFFLTIFGIDLFFACRAFAPGELMSLQEFFGANGAVRLGFDVIAMGIAGGLFIVPLYALIQERSPNAIRSRVIAANNILNAGFVALASILAIIFLRAGISIPQLLLITAIFNAVVALFIFKLVPEFVLRFVAWLAVHTIYRADVKGLEHIPERGPAILIANHVSQADAIILMAYVRRPIRFVMAHYVFKNPVLGYLFRAARAIPIGPAKTHPELLDQAFDDIATALESGELIGLFPEGRLTTTGQMQPFRPGIEKILARTPVPVIPIALQGLWASIFSPNPNTGWKDVRKRIGAKVGVVIASPQAPSDVTAEKLQDIVSKLRGDRA